MHVTHTHTHIHKPTPTHTSTNTHIHTSTPLLSEIEHASLFNYDSYFLTHLIPPILFRNDSSHCSLFSLPKCPSCLCTSSPLHFSRVYLPLYDKKYISLHCLLFNVLIFNQFHILYTQQLSFEHSPLWQLLQKSGIPILYDHSEKILETFHHSSTPHYFTTYVSCLTPNTQTASFFKNAGTCTPVPQVFFNL